MDLKSAHEFLTRCFSPEETIALLLRNESSAKVSQRIVKLETVLTRRYLAWLAYENAGGSNVYVVANPLRDGSRKRTKENIDSVRHLYIDLDTDGDTRLAAIKASVCVPRASTIVSTSPGKYQVLWQVAGFDFERQETILKQLAIAFGGDPACTDRNRVLRVPGFFNRKYDPADLVTAEYLWESVWTPADFRAVADAVDAMPHRYAAGSQRQPGKHSNSEDDWAWVSHELAQGIDATKLTRELASRRSDKPNPLYYAQRTVDVASARLWLTEGILRAEVAAGYEGNAHGFEIVAADDVVFDVNRASGVAAGNEDGLIPRALTEGEGGEAGGRDGMDGGDALLDLLIEGGEAGFVVHIADGAGVEIEDEGVVAVEAGIDMVEVDEAVDEQDGADEKDKREGDLSDDERFGERRFCGTAVGAAAVFEGIDKIEPGGAECGERAEEKSGEDGDGEGEKQEARVDGDIEGDGVWAAGDHVKQEPVCEGGEGNAKRSADGCEQQTFREELANETRTAATERLTDGEFADAGCGTGQ